MKQQGNTQTRNRHTRTMSGVLAGLTVAAIVVACKGKPTTTDSTSSGVSTPQTVVPVSTSIEPSMPTSQPTMPTIQSSLPEVPPTAAETKSAWQEGIAAFESRDYETAGARLQIAAAGRPDDAYVHYIHGLALWKSGHLVEAEDALVRSSSINGSSIKTWINLARVRMQRQDFQGALSATDEAITLDPGSADALHQRGRALSGLGRKDEALEALQQARTADPENGYIANTLGHLLLTTGRVDEAIPNLEAARDRLPEVAFVRNNLGVAYERKDDLDRAAEEYRAAVEAGDSDGKAAASLARIEPLVTPRLAGDPEPDAETTTEGGASF
jgi:tetratricopeptide (TPR) repeat protein